MIACHLREEAQPYGDVTDDFAALKVEHLSQASMCSLELWVLNQHFRYLRGRRR